MAVAPFPVQPRLVAVAGMYRNRRLIADQVLPRISTGGTQTYKWLKHTMADGFSVPDTRVGRASKPNQVEFSAVELAGQTYDYGIDVPIPNADRKNAAGQADAAATAAMDPEAKATVLGTNIILLDREVRTANKIFALATYPASQRTTLSGTSQWSDYTNSDPVEAILAALEIPVARPNFGVMGRQAWTKVRRHPKVLEAILGKASTSGLLTVDQVRDALELEELLIGEGLLNTARPGQAVNMTRVWGKHAAFYYLDPAGGPMDMPSFGWTAEWDSRTVVSIEDKDMGVRGGERIRVSESVDEQIAAPDLGYFFQNVVA